MSLFLEAQMLRFGEAVVFARYKKKAGERGKFTLTFCSESPGISYRKHDHSLPLLGPAELYDNQSEHIKTPDSSAIPETRNLCPILQSCDASICQLMLGLDTINRYPTCQQMNLLSGHF